MRWFKVRFWPFAAPTPTRHSRGRARRMEAAPKAEEPPRNPCRAGRRGARRPFGHRFRPDPAPGCGDLKPHAGCGPRSRQPPNCIFVQFSHHSSAVVEEIVMTTGCESPSPHDRQPDPRRGTVRQWEGRRPKFISINNSHLPSSGIRPPERRAPNRARWRFALTSSSAVVPPGPRQGGLPGAYGRPGSRHENGS